MSTAAIVIVIIAAVVVVALAAYLVSLELRRRHLRQQFGPEYDRLRDDTTGRRAAVQELSERQRRHRELGIRPVSAMARDRYTKNWALIQASFVDRPSKAVDEADRLVVTIMEERGYPYGKFEERVSMLSVEHGSVLHHYRAGHELRARHAVSELSTEDLRTALVHYRTLIEDLLDARAGSIRPKAEPDVEPETETATPIAPPTETAERAPVLPAARDVPQTERRPEEPEIIDLPAADTSLRPEAENRVRPEPESNRA